jgi:hypothetical protein
VSRVYRSFRSRAPPALRCCRLWLQITDQRGLSRCYTVTPRPNDPAAFRMYVLRYYVDGGPITHTVLCDETGACRCSCPGYTHHQHCKHVDALQAAGLVESQLLAELHRQKLEFASKMDELAEDHVQLRSRLAAVNNVLPDPHAPTNSARPRRRRKPEPLSPAA